VNVVELKTRTAEVDQTVIETLEAALAFAKEGNLKCVCVVGVMPDGAAFTTASATDCGIAMMGSLSVMQHRLLVNREIG